MSGQFVTEAVDRAVVAYTTTAALPGPEREAAFGWACVELMKALDCTLGAAAALLRAELDRRSVGLCKPP